MHGIYVLLHQDLSIVYPLLIFYFNGYLQSYVKLPIIIAIISNFLLQQGTRDPRNYCLNLSTSLIYIGLYCLEIGLDDLQHHVMKRLWGSAIMCGRGAVSNFRWIPCSLSESLSSALRAEVCNQSINNHLTMIKADKRRNCDYNVGSIVRSSELWKRLCCQVKFSMCLCTKDER